MNTLQQFTQPIYKDSRGSFIPVNLTDRKWIQSNISINRSCYTFRGMHIQKAPYEQTKLVSVVQGRIADMVIDLRFDSIEYGKCSLFILNEGDSLLVPKGYAHGFLTLDSNTIVNYLVDVEYNQNSDVSISWKSIPDIVKYINRFTFEGTEEMTISDKDLNGILLENYK